MLWLLIYQRGGATDVGFDSNDDGVKGWVGVKLYGLDGD